MNGADSTDDENGVLYFLPGGIADDSPPRRTLGMSSPVPSSFGSIGPAQPTAQPFRMHPTPASEANNFLLSGLGGVAVPNTQSMRDRSVGGGGFGSFGSYGYSGRLGGPPGGSSTPTNGGGIGSIGSSSFLSSNNNAGGPSQPMPSPSTTTFSRSAFMSASSTSSTTGPLRAPPGLDVSPPSAASSFLPSHQRMLDRQSDSLHSAFNFLPQNPTATHPPLHPVQPPASTSSAALFSSSGIPVQSNMELAELNTTSVVIDQQQPAPLSRLFLDDPPNKDGKNSIGVHRFRNTFLDHRPEDIPSQHPLAPLRSLSTTGRPSMSTVRSPGHSTEPKQEIPPPSTKIRDPYSGKRHGSPSSASSLDSDVGSTPTSGSTLLSSMTFAGKAAANVSSPAPRVVPGQIRIKQRGDGMSPKKPTVADAATASSRGNTASRSHTHAATSVSNRRQTSVYREKYPKAITTSVEATPPVAAGAKTSTPRRNGRAADKTSPRVSGGGGSETTNVPVDATNVPTTPRSIKSKSSTPSGESSHVVPSPQRGNLNRQGSPTVTEPVPSSADGAAGDITVVEDSTDEGLVSQDTDHDNATAATDVAETPPYDKARDNERRIGDGGASDASVDDDVPAPCPLIELSSPPSPKPSTDQAVATKEELQASPAFDVPELKNVALVTEPASQHDHDDVSVAAPLHQPVHHEVQPPSSEDDMPTRPATAPVLSKKRSDKRNRRTAAASDNVPAAISTNAPKAHGPMDKKKSDSGMKLSHRRQDHGKDETSCADGSAAPPHRSPYPNEDDDDDLFAPVPRSAWSVMQSAFVASCVWLVSASGASTGLPWLLTCVQWVLSTLMTLIFHVGFHALTYGIKFHRFVVRGLVLNRNIASCFAFLYLFPLLVQYVIPWAPPWAPVCLWYAFLVQLFCTQGSTTMVATFRILLPLVFLVEGVSHHSFLLDLNGAELLLISFILSAVKTGNLYSPVFFMSLSLQCLSAVFLGSEMFVQWLQLAIALYSLHSMATDEWGDLDDGRTPTPFPHASSPFLGDVHHPSGTSIQKTKRLDRRSMAAVVKGRKPRAASST